MGLTLRCKSKVEGEEIKMRLQFGEDNRPTGPKVEIAFGIRGGGALHWRAFGAALLMGAGRMGQDKLVVTLEGDEETAQAASRILEAPEEKP